MKYFKITHPDINNGLGCRVTVWISGCRHACVNCHNQALWDFNKGKDWNSTIESRIYEILSLPYMKGITFSGGDPLYSYEEVMQLCGRIKEKFPDKDIWLYTGFTYEEVCDQFPKVFDCVDTLVTDPYIDELRDTTLPWVGSSNQRVHYLK